MEYYSYHIRAKEGEEKQMEILNKWSIAERLHKNFYDREMPKIQVEANLDIVDELIAKLGEYKFTKEDAKDEGFPKFAMHAFPKKLSGRRKEGGGWSF